MSDDVEAVLEEDGDRHLPDLRAEEAGHVFDDAPEAELSKLAVAERTLEEPRSEEDVRSQVKPARESSSWGLRGLNRRIALSLGDRVTSSAERRAIRAADDAVLRRVAQEIRLDLGGNSDASQ